jgi:hypothetical protein
VAELQFRRRRSRSRFVRDPDSFSTFVGFANILNNSSALLAATHAFLSAICRAFSAGRDLYCRTQSRQLLQSVITQACAFFFVIFGVCEDVTPIDPSGRSQLPFD